MSRPSGIVSPEQFEVAAEGTLLRSYAVGGLTIVTCHLAHCSRFAEVSSACSPHRYWLADARGFARFTRRAGSRLVAKASLDPRPFPNQVLPPDTVASPPVAAGAERFGCRKPPGLLDVAPRPAGCAVGSSSHHAGMNASMRQY